MSAEDAARYFLLAGGVLTWHDWVNASPEQQQAWLTAGEKVQAQRLFDLVQAFHGPEGLASVLTPVDGGATADKLQLKKAIEKYVRRTNAAVAP